MSHAQLAVATYPEKSLRLIAPFAPGGGTDQMSRALGAGLTKVLGQTVVIENKPGAGTVIGMDLVARSAPDGYTLVLATFAHAVNSTLQSKLPYDSEHAFTPVALIARGPNVLVVRAESPFQSVKEIVAAAKAQPSKLTYASQGNGTSAHLAGEMLQNLGNIELTHIPYRGASLALTDLLGGQVDLFIGTAAGVSPLILSGKLRAVAVTSPMPSAAFEGIATVAATLPGYAVESWYGLYAPAGTPASVIATLNAAVRQTVKNPDFIQKIENEGLTLSVGQPSELEQYVATEKMRWKKVILENKIQVQ
ncbi:MAG: tripartite tricarboxylate transporter substrate binding protein [Alcaligenaceae bacterium]